MMIIINSDNDSDNDTFSFDNKLNDANDWGIKIVEILILLEP